MQCGFAFRQCCLCCIAEAILIAEASVAEAICCIAEASKANKRRHCQASGTCHGIQGAAFAPTQEWPEIMPTLSLLPFPGQVEQNLWLREGDSAGWSEEPCLACRATETLGWNVGVRLRLLRKD